MHTLRMRIIFSDEFNKRLADRPVLTDIVVAAAIAAVVVAALVVVAFVVVVGDVERERVACASAKVIAAFYTKTKANMSFGY